MKNTAAMELGRLGGLRRSGAKAEAARLNGRKGGRRPKVAKDYGSMTAMEYLEWKRSQKGDGVVGQVKLDPEREAILAENEAKRVKRLGAYM